jgi:hypothetical protein
VVVDGNRQTPGGGLVFNVRFRGSLSLGTLVSDSAHAVRQAIRHDPGFFAIYFVVLLVLAGWCGWAGVRRVARGR